MGVAWTLEDLFTGIGDPRIEATLARAEERAVRFEERYRGRIDHPELTAETLRDAIAEYEAILQEKAKPMSFASLLFAADTSDPGRGAFLQQMRERSTQIALRMLFFELELMRTDEERVHTVLADPVLAPYRHFVEVARTFRNHQLSEAEEKVLEEKANTGPRAFRRLFEEVVSNIAFRVERDGATETLTQSEVIARMRDPDREVRRTAAAGLSAGLEENARVLTFIFNTLIQDKSVEDRLRRYTFPEEARHLGNELPPETVDLVVETVVRHYPLVARYYRTKRAILGLDELTHYDRYAPILATKEEVPFERGRDLVLDAFRAFSPTIEERAREFFEKRWIDAEPRKGKRGGAFCSYTTPDLHPYIFANYLNRLDDVMTLAHELGHGVHASLSRRQSYLNFHGTLPLAELASTFGEMLVFEKLQAEASREDRRALYADKIEGTIATVFRQVALYRFERAIHARRREKGELTTEEFSAFWQEETQAMHGDSVLLGEEHRLWWLYISHFISSPFYVYAYAFGELLVMALYQRYKREGSSFVARYIELLEAGGSMSPQALMARVGIDLNDPDFWQGGLRVVEGMVAEFEALTPAPSAPPPRSATAGSSD
jgi:oligoendopeptidase F